MIEKKKISNWNELVGKTISAVCEQNRFSQEAVLYFTDGSLAILKSEHDYESGCHWRISFDDTPSVDMQVRIGEITEEEAQVVSEEQYKMEAIRNLEIIKRRYPELLKF